MKFIIPVCTLVALLFQIGALQAGMMETIPAGEEVYQWIYEYVDELYARGLITDLHLGTKPYFRGKVAEELLSLQERIKGGQLSVNRSESYLLEELENEFSGEISELKLKAASPQENKPSREFLWGLDFKEGSNFQTGQKTTFKETFWPYAKARVGSNFFACARYVIDENLAQNPQYDGKIWRGFAGDATQAYLAFNFPYFKLLLGRERLAWGQRPAGELILSENASPLDLVKLQGGWGIFQGTAFFAFLSSLSVPDAPEPPAEINRYLSGHRIDLDLFSWAQIGLSETIVYGGKNRQVEAYYLNPLLWYHGAQLNEKKDDNTFFALDFNFRPKKDVLFYGEFLIDDLQIENKNQADQEPNELGYFGGFSIFDAFSLKGTRINLEYVRINNWTYNQTRDYNRYLHNNMLLGNPLGPDTENLSIKFSARLKRRLKSEITYQKRRCGEGSVNSPWSEPWMLSAGEYQEKFPSGVVERMSDFGITLLYNYTNIFRCTLGWDYYVFHNYQNIPDRKEAFNRVNVALSCHFMKM